MQCSQDANTRKKVVLSCKFEQCSHKHPCFSSMLSSGIYLVISNKDRNNGLPNLLLGYFAVSCHVRTTIYPPVTSVVKYPQFGMWMCVLHFVYKKSSICLIIMLMLLLDINPVVVDSSRLYHLLSWLNAGRQTTLILVKLVSSSCDGMLSLDAGCLPAS